MAQTRLFFVSKPVIKKVRRIEVHMSLKTAKRRNIYLEDKKRKKSGESRVGELLKKTQN